jgi:hypothetical protein
MIFTRSRQANKENQMTAVLILNIVFAAFVIVGMLALLGGANFADRRPSAAPRRGARPSAVRSTSRAPVAKSARRMDPAI